MNITAIVTAMQNRNAAWLGVYKAFAEETMSESKLAAALNSDDSAWGQANLGKASAQTISYYRRAWALAANCPEAAARVGKDGQIHKAICYAVSKGVSTKSVDTWIRHTVKATEAQDADAVVVISAALNELRELGKNKQQANKDEETAPAETVETVETVADDIADPDAMVWQAVDLLRAALEMLGGVSIDSAEAAAGAASVLWDALMADLDQVA